MEAEDEDVGPRLRSGARYGLRRLTKPVNSHRDRFEHELSGTNVVIKGQTTRHDIKSRSVHKTRWHNSKNKGKAFKCGNLSRNQFTRIVEKIFT